MPHTFVVLAYQKSEYLEACIRSVMHQTRKSKVVLATSTPNSFIKAVAEKYELELFCTPQPGKGIGADFDFARTCTGDSIVTIAHQDDIYDPCYAQLIQEAFQENPDASILFSDYYEIRNGKKVFTNTNLKVKHLLLLAARNPKYCDKKLAKRAILSLGTPICCPAVTFVNKNIAVQSVFSNTLKSNVDWYAWELLSRQPGRFVYLPEPLMGHRVHDGSTTSEIIHDNLRTKEDLFMLKQFWPEPIALFLNQIYMKSQNSNEVE